MGSKRIVYVCYQGQSPQKVLQYDPNVDHHGVSLLGWGAPPAGWDSGGGDDDLATESIGIDNDDDTQPIFLHHISDVCLNKCVWKGVTKFTRNF